MAGDTWGGSEELWADTALKLLEQGHSVRAMVEYWPNLHWKVKRLMERGADVHLRQPHPVPSLAARGYRKLTKNFLPQPVLDPFDAWIRDEDPELTIISMGNYLENGTWM